MKRIRREILSCIGIKDVAFDGKLLFSFEDLGTVRSADEFQYFLNLENNPFFKIRSSV